MARSATHQGDFDQPGGSNALRQDEPADADHGMQVKGRWFVLVITLTAVFMQLLDTTITTVAVPSIQSKLGASSAEIQLVLAGYSLAFACALITGGRLGDIYGRRRLFLIGMTGFTIVSAICGAAPNPTTLVIARLIQGAFSALMFPQVLSILQVVFPRVQRAKALAIYGATIGLATILGPVTGGFLIDLNIAHSDWRSIFYINVPIGVIAIAFGIARIPESKVSGAARLDLLGAGLITIGLFMLVFPLVVGRDQGWPLWSFLMMAGGVLVIAAFGAYEHRRTLANNSPLVNTKLFRQRPFTLGLISCIMFFTGIPSFFYVLLLTLQAGFAFSAVAAGAVTLGFALAVAIGSARSSEVVKRIGVRVLAVGCVLLIIGQLGVISTLTWMGSGLHGWYLIPSLFVAGAGAGLFLAPVTGVILAGVETDDAGSASGLLATAQQVGAAVGIACVGVIFFAFLGTNSTAASRSAHDELRANLANAGVPAVVQQQIVANFDQCFHDKTHAKDLSSTPASCAAAQREMQSGQLPAAVTQQVMHATTEVALPAARKADFSATLRDTLWWHVGAFFLTLLLVVRLPRVKLPQDGPMIAGG
ncbi:MAG: MFS transporter [Actinomycetota bacterium]|nr:MFS transporter [Actinomycetota bacterium]MDQ2957170.1 MFS transporter [Actinomycetota bacterium]